MPPVWFRKRRYAHFDVPVGDRFAKLAQDPAFVARHAFSPLISYEKLTKRYLRPKRRIELKSRKIMYASHRDACILSYYSHILSAALEEAYISDGTGDNVVAYRSLGKANYHFSAEALKFARDNYPCIILAYDVTKFFDTLDHRLLKDRLKNILDVQELSADWYAVFRHVTKFRHVALADLTAHPVFGDRVRSKKARPIATVAELKAEKIAIVPNAHAIGIPQGTPISSPLANLYLRQFDIDIANHAREVGGFYRRYSDDILFICTEQYAATAEAHILATLKAERLEISLAKSERTNFEPGSDKAAQYLGFSLHPAGAAIRSASMSRQWRKMRKAVKRTRAAGEQSIAAGTSKKIYTKKIRKRFSKLPVRNFSSYARRSAAALGSPQVIRQVRRIEKEFQRLMMELKS